MLSSLKPLRLALRALAMVAVLSTGAARAAIIIDGDVTAPLEPTVGVAGTAGTSTSTAAVAGGGSGNAFPTAEAPLNAFDNNTGTKYLNFGKTGVGLITTLSTNGPQAIVNGLRLTTANDAPERDPLTVTLEGTNDPNPTTTLNSTWTSLYSGVTGLATDPGRLGVGPTVSFVNVLPFSSYRLLVTGVRTPTSANSFQVSEVELIGSTVPEPATFALVAVPAVALLWRRRRRAL